MVHDLVQLLMDGENHQVDATARLCQFEVTISFNKWGFFIIRIIDCSQVDVERFSTAYDVDQIREQILDLLQIINQTGHNIVLEPTLSYN